MDNSNHERAEFEAWLDSTAYFENQHPSTTEMLWRAWQARAKLPATSPIAVLTANQGSLSSLRFLSGIERLENGDHELYTAPPLARPALTEDSILKILTVELRDRLNVWPNFEYGGHRYFRSNGSPANVRDCDFVAFARAVEAALGLTPPLMDPLQIESLKD